MSTAKRYKVLLFEDEHSFSDLLKKVIEGFGHEVISIPDPSACSSFSETASICTKREPCADVVLTHCQMANASGIELFKLQSERGCKVPIDNKALMAANASIQHLPSVVNLGCSFLTKPFSFVELENWLNECFKRAAEKNHEVSRLPG